MERYAVTSNGGTIFYKGIEDKDWTNHVRKGMDNSVVARDLVHKFNEIFHPSWVIKDSGKLADNLFYYCLIE